MTDRPLPIDTTQPVMITGATGFVAGWIVHDLLTAGVTVHATVRDASNTAKTAHLTQMARDLPGNLRLFEADLLRPEGFAQAMQGCGIVFHTASPFSTSVTDPQRDLVDPALLGTRNVLEAVNACASVHRVVLTSSVTAMFGDVADLADAPGGVLTEALWNTTSSLAHQPYPYSKTLAERAAWEMAEAQDRWRLVVINPALVIGPSLGPNPTSDSFELVKALGDGRTRTGAPRLSLGAVDVRDLAFAHLAAAYLPQAQGRHIVSGHDTDMLELGLALRDRFGATHPLPKRAMPKWLFWLVGPLIGPVTRRYISHNVERPYATDNSKSRTALGVRYRPLQASMEDMFAQMVARGSFG